MGKKYDPSDKLLKFNECKDLLRIEATTLYGLLQAGRIEHFKLGGRYLIPMSAIVEYLEKCRD